MFSLAGNVIWRSCMTQLSVTSIFGPIHLVHNIKYLVSVMKGLLWQFTTREFHINLIESSTRIFDRNLVWPWHPAEKIDWRSSLPILYWYEHYVCEFWVRYEKGLVKYPGQSLYRDLLRNWHLTLKSLSRLPPPFPSSAHSVK